MNSYVQMKRKAGNGEVMEMSTNGIQNVYGLKLYRDKYVRIFMYD